MQLDKEHLLIRKASLIVSARTNEWSVANVLKWWESRGEYVCSMSELVRISIEALNQILITQGIVEPFKDIVEARQYLEAHHLVKPSMIHRTKKVYADAVSQSVMAEPGVNGSLKEKLENAGYHQTGRITKADVPANLQEQIASAQETLRERFSCPSDELSDGDMRDDTLSKITKELKERQEEEE